MGKTPMRLKSPHIKDNCDPTPHVVATWKYWISLTKSSGFQMKPETCLLCEVFLCKIFPFKKTWDHTVCADQSCLDKTCDLKAGSVWSPTWGGGVFSPTTTLVYIPLLH